MKICLSMYLFGMLLKNIHSISMQKKLHQILTLRSIYTSYTNKHIHQAHIESPHLNKLLKIKNIYIQIKKKLKDTNGT